MATTVIDELASVAPPVPSTTLDDVSVTAPAPTAATQGPQATPYEKRLISLTFQLATGSFQGTNSNTLTVSGLRTFVVVQKASMPATGQLYLRVQGLTLAQINTLTKAGTTFQQGHNVVSVAAGDVGGTLATVFTGEIFYAYPDFSNQPDVSFVVQASSTGTAQLQPVSPVSFPGPVPVAQALTQIIQPAGWTLKNNGVTVTLATPYFWGTVWQQVQQAVKAANCAASYDATSKTLTIWPRSGATIPGSPVLISPQTGMIGYPEFQQTQIKVRTLFAPNTLVGASQQITVQSQLTSANGNWNAYQVTYLLDAEAPGGKWEMAIDCAPTSLSGPGGTQ
jgi:hypothetical protein